MADIVLLFVLKGRDCMSKVLIEVLVIILIAGSYLILYSAVRVSAIADQRIAEIQKRETFDKEKQLNTSQSSISGGMAMANEKKKIEDLSLGNLKKLGIILAFMHEPKILILDEPTSGLDPIMQNVFYDLLKEEKAKGNTIFYSTHILNEVSKICDRVGIIKDGKLIKVEKIEPENILYLDALPVSTIEVENYQDGIEEIRKFLISLNLKNAEKIVSLLSQTYAMRGAILLDVDTMERLEPDRERGIRATYMDAERTYDNLVLEGKNHYAEAIVLATKVANAPNIIGEICISDDPDYVTGYVASKSTGYRRITKMKEMGSENGGRIFLYQGSKEDVAGSAPVQKYENNPFGTDVNYNM